MAYATYQDVQARMSRTMSVDEQAICTNLLDDAAVIIDAYNSKAKADNTGSKSLYILHFNNYGQNRIFLEGMFGNCY